MKKTTEQFKEEIFGKYGNEFDILGEYQGKEIPLLVRHHVNGSYHDYKVRPADLKRRGSCSICHRRKRTHDEFVKEVDALVGGEYIVASHYINSKTKVTFLHLTEEGIHLFNMTPDAFINQHSRCPECCVRRVPDSLEVMMAKLEDKFSGEFEYKEGYVNGQTNCQFVHHTDLGSHEIISTPARLLNTGGCGVCKNTNLSHDDFVQLLFEKYGDEFTVLSTYNLTSNKLLVRHNTKENPHDFEVIAGDLLHRKTCCVCNPRSKTHEEFVEQIKEKFGEEYEVLSRYINNKTPIRVRHICETGEHEFIKEPSSMINQHQGCPLCAPRSKGEEKIQQYLEQTGREYQKEFHISLTNNTFMRVDFMILENGQPIAGIEYDGEQHFHPVEQFGGKEGFEKTQARDQVKNQYFKDMGIPLLRISYLEYERIEEILSENINLWFS
ncbi:DUF2726 domain-containing protein [Vagococcus zengguangii]|uniref:DUF2726 domain-containing protein n=1 Tax=Vagococcus zengguangii TaxID=2571750 RepID=A0A4D7CT21_9ENTE|nr:DUF2726 domain-containing protein [Vagococcus zengguangii]QCI86313.1 DUF2726 domain-containing protein [Vagococcus zengguangii]